MAIDNKLFDNLTRVAGGAASILSAMGKQLGDGLKDRMEDRFGSSPFSGPFPASAANDDMDRLQGVVTKLRLEQEELKARVAELEALLGVKKAAPKAKTATKKPVAKKVAAKKTAAKKPATKKSAKKRS